MKIGIDPGHGGRDPGAVANGLQEKDITLAVALRLAEFLENCGQEVVLTRREDQTVSLRERSTLFNRERVDVALSLHVNSTYDTNAGYLSTWIYPGSKKGRVLAECVQDKLVRLVGWPDGGVREANFHMLRETAMPAVLVEMGFLSNPAQAQKLGEVGTQILLAVALKCGIGAYARKISA